MIHDLNIFNPPSDPNAKIWRYMDFAKYVSLLETQNLYFARIDRLDDRFEGTYPDTNKGLTTDAKKVFRWLRQWTFVNCWHQNDDESAAMWKLYAKTNQAVAIQSTYMKLRAQLPSEVYVGLVEYSAYDSDTLPEGHSLFPFVHKRKFFEHERELRAIFQKFPRTAQGRYALEEEQWDDEKPQPVALADLISCVYVAPTAPEWFRNTVEAVTHHYGFKLHVIKSSLDKDPVESGAA